VVPEVVRIVIAEDHAMVREGMKLVISGEPAFEWVGEAGDGLRALDLVRSLQPDILLLDLGMPQLDGLEVMRAIGAETLPTRVLVVTAREDPASVRSALALGAQGYLLKTDDADALLHALRTVAAGGWHVSPELANLFDPQVDAHAPTEPLTPREADIARRVGRGLSSKRIGLDLGISEHTVRKHRENISRKLGLRNVAELVAWSIRHQQ
jgi:DNA-binding NarL/FixJ family response regulator